MKLEGKCNRSTWLGRSVVECSRGKRETVGLSLGGATFFFYPCGWCAYYGMPVI